MKLNLETAKLKDISRVAKECRAMVTTRAWASAGASIVPIPGADVAADIGMLMQLLPAITNRFSLDESDLNGLPSETKAVVAKALADVATKFIGKTLTEEVVVSMLKRFSTRLATIEVAKFIPVLGSAAAATISFTMMKLIGNQHINECEKAITAIIKYRDSKGA